MPSGRSPASKTPASGAHHPPVLTVTRYDLVSTFMIAVVIALVIAVLWLGVVWASNLPPAKSEAVPVEFIELPGGDPDGAVDETLRVDSPEDVAEDPSVEEVIDEEIQVEETIENVLELADEASQQVQQQFETDARSSGKLGSATGTGRRGLGEGPGEGGLPREQRWYIRFSEEGSVNEYARQLDYFGIEMGALLPGGSLVLISNVSNDTPTKRTLTSGKGENRLYMTWQGGSRKSVDGELFQKAGVNISRAVIFHFYSREAEQKLARLEREYRDRDVKEIRRTYFVVHRVGREYEFAVTRQVYF